jgi:hypothetical protein
MSGGLRSHAIIRTKLAPFAAELGTLDSPALLGRRLLDIALALVPAQGPCSALPLHRFVTEGGGYAGIPHHRNPPSAELVAAWHDHTRRVASSIEQRLFARKKKTAVGTARLSDLFDPNEWPGSPLASLAKQADLGDMAYLWIRCSDKELWIVCLRRRSSEPAFTDRDFAVLEELGAWFSGIRKG